MDREKLTNHLYGWQCPLCNTVHSPSVEKCDCTKKVTVKEQTANWLVWAGWAGNHDQRIDSAECSNCGYEHPTVYGSIEKLAKYCPGCGRTMSVKYTG